MSLIKKNPALCLIVFIAVCFLYLLQERVENGAESTEVIKSTAGKVVLAGRVVEISTEESAAEAIIESSSEELVTEPEIVEVAMPAPLILKPISQLRRGTNSRLLLPEAVTTERNMDPRSVSSEVLFSARTQPISGSLTIDEHTLSAVEADVDFFALKSFVASTDGAIRLPLSQDTVILATFDKVITRGEHTTTLLGQVVDDSFSDVLLVFHDGAVSGSVAFHDTNTHYQFAMAGNGDVAIRHLDTHSFDAGCGDPDHVCTDIASLAEEELSVDEPDGEVLEAPVGATPFDSVIGYSAEARISDGGTAAIEARIIGSVDRMNTALSNSESGDWFCSLLAMVEEPDATFMDSNFTQLHQILSHLNDTDDGVLDTLTDLKVELGADQATFVSDGPIGGAAGVANRPGIHSIAARNYMSSAQIVFAHEVGHNLGLRHGWGDTGTVATNPTNQSNYGWRFDPPNGGKVRTIMAYGAGWGGSRIVHFANPDVIYNGAPTGAAKGFDATDNGGTPAYDQKFVSGGDVGVLGAGFDGTNADLGARNGDYLKYNSGTLANKRARVGLAVVEPVVGTQFLPGASTTIFWYGGDHTDTVQVDLYKGGVFHSAIASGLSGEDRWYDWTVPNITGGTDYVIRITLSGSTTADSGFFTIGTPIVSVPYTESFENGLGAWLQSAADDFDWTRHSGATATNATGPDAASSGDWYLYIEPNDFQNVHYKIAQIDCTFDLSTVTGAELSFDYHMYGVNIDYLAVDVYDGAAWATDVWKLSNAQHSSNSDPWSNAVVDLSAYAGNSAVTIRFRAKQKQWHVSDIAIDNIIVDGPQSLPYAESFESGLVGLRQSQDDDLDWTLNSGGTPDTNTGPDGASEGSQYMYVENHDSGVQYKTASLEGTFDFSTAVEPELTFDYHMYGFYIDYLAIDIHDGSDWISDVWIRSGQQHSSVSDPWSNAMVDLSAYAGNGSVTIRFRSKQKQWHAADTAIDNVQINDAIGPLVAHWSLDDNSGLTAVDNEGHGFDATVSGTTSWVPGIDGAALDFDGSTSTVTLPASAFSTITDEITISMWVYGAADQPRNDSLLYAVNSSGNRMLNVHLPWNDGTVYWDAGFSGTYDRIEKMASTLEYKDQWNHWAFTKNATTGDMAIYLNGELWHSGASKTRSMAGITAATLGSQISGLNYSGMVDDVRLYNESLDATEVSDLFLDYTTTGGVPFGWLMGHGIDPSDAGAQLNADADSQNNEAEWIFGTDPLVGDSPIKTLLSDGSMMTITYTRRKLDDVDIYAVWYPDLTGSTWSTSGLTEVVTADDGVVETVEVTLPMTGGQKFVRIKAE